MHISMTAAQFFDGVRIDGIIDHDNDLDALAWIVWPFNGRQRSAQTSGRAIRSRSRSRSARDRFHTIETSGVVMRRDARRRERWSPDIRMAAHAHRDPPWAAYWRKTGARSNAPSLLMTTPLVFNRGGNDHRALRLRLRERIARRMVCAERWRPLKARPIHARASRSLSVVDDASIRTPSKNCAAVMLMCISCRHP